MADYRYSGKQYTADFSHDRGFFRLGHDIPVPAVQLDHSHKLLHGPTDRDDEV
jgi:hypothetical protein